MLFKIIASKDPFTLNPELLAIPEFERLTDKQMRYVALYCDYGSPFRKLPDEDRKLQAALTAGYKRDKDGRPDTNCRNTMAGKVSSVAEAIFKYKDIQVDEDKETLLSITQLIRDVRALNVKPEKSTQDLIMAVANTTKHLMPLMETKKKLEALLDMREDNVVETEKGQIVVTDEDYIDESKLSVLSQLMDEETPN